MAECNSCRMSLHHAATSYLLSIVKLIGSDVMKTTSLSHIQPKNNQSISKSSIPDFFNLGIFEIEREDKFPQIREKTGQYQSPYIDAYRLQ